MKRFLAFFLCLLLAFPLPAFAAKESPSIIASGTAAAGAVLLSTVNGTAFVDVNGDATLSAALQAAVTHNDVIEFTSKTDKTKKIWGFVKAAGSAEDLGDAANVSNCVNSSYDTFDGVSATGFHAVSLGGATKRGGSADEIAVAIGELWKISISISVASGAVGGVAFRNTYGGTYLGAAFSPPMTSTGARYTTATVSATGVIDVSCTIAAEFTVSNLAAQKVTAPSSSGVTITTTPGGATYNWGVNTLSGTSYNDASGYDWKIISSTKYGQVIASGAITSANARFDGTAANAFAWLNGVDLTSYQTGNYILWLSDGTNVAWGYISATAPVGDGGGNEDLGDEFITSLTNFGYETFTPNANGRDIDQAVNSAGPALAVTNGTVAPGTLYKITTNCSVSTGSGPYLEASNTDNNTTRIDPVALSGVNTNYRTAASLGGKAQKGFGLYMSSGLNGDYAIVWSSKRVLDPPPTGALILQSKGGARGWTNLGSTNLNAVTSYRIYRAY